MTARPHDADHADGPRRDEGQPDEIIVGLVADPDLPAALADQLQDALPDLLHRAVEPPARWTVQVVHDPFEQVYPDYGGLLAAAREQVRNTVWDLAVCVTDLPVQDESGIAVASVDSDGRVAVVSLPALGGVFLRRRLRALLVAIIASLTRSEGPPDPTTTGAELRRRLRTRGNRVVDPGPDRAHHQVVRSGRQSTARLLGGMVRANRPWRLLLGLSLTMAGAVTGIAFGVLFSSIWLLATSLDVLRLAGLTLAALATLAGWIIGKHRLWERRHPDADGRSNHVVLRNLSMLVTVAVGTAAFFLAIFAVALAATALVIPPSFLAATLGRPVGVSDYVTIATVAAVLGTLAGAVGSSLEDETEVQEATYGYRERERRHRAERDADRDTGPMKSFRRQ